MHVILLPTVIAALVVITVAYFKYSYTARVSWEDLDESWALVFREDQKGIICLECGHVSYHPDDVREKYCSYCNKFHNDPSKGDSP